MSREATTCLARINSNSVELNGYTKYSLGEFIVLLYHQDKMDIKAIPLITGDDCHQILEFTKDRGSDKVAEVPS